MRPIWTQVANVLTPEECKEIVDACKPLAKTAKFKNENKYGIFSKIKRNSKVTWITQGSTLDPLIQKVFFVIAQQALKQHGVLLNNFEAVQFTEYGMLGHYNTHRDVGDTGDYRLISASVQLSPPNTYIGGDLWIDTDNDLQPTKDQGSVIIFPSILKHAVKPVWHGTRHSLVFWGQFVKNDNT